MEVEAPTETRLSDVFESQEGSSSVSDPQGKDHDSSNTRGGLRINTLQHVKECGSVDYINYSELLEVAAELLLPSGKTRSMRVLVDCGATSNFINLDTVMELGIPYDTTKADKVAT